MSSYIDTHCHLYLNTKKDEQNIIENFITSWWKYMICIWVDLETSKKAVELAKKYDFIFATIWIHPSDSIKYIWNIENTITALEEIYKGNKENIVWIWECWLDYFHTDTDDIDTVENQKLFFKAQIDLAKKLNMPVVIHNRDSKEDVYNIIVETQLKNFILHCFSEDLDYAKKLINYSPNCKISFSWIVTFKSALDVQKVAAKIPLKNIIIETDSPFLTPTPYRWKEENEPSYTRFVLDKIKELRSESLEEIESEILNNSINIFKIKKNNLSYA